MPLRGARALERIPLIPVGEDAPEVTPSTPRRAPAPTGALTRDGIFAFGILLVVALGLSVALASRSRPRVVLWDDATAYPLAPLAIAPHTTADVLRTALESSSAEDEDAPRSWLAAPPTVAVFAWEDGVFTLNAVRPPRRDEREGSGDDDDVDARTNRERRDARAEDRALARWRARDFAALLGEARSKRSSDDASARSLRMKEYASAYAAFSALAYTAMAYAPHRFKPGNDPFHVVLNPLASPFAPGCVRSAPRGFLRRDPCPEAKRWKAPTLDFAASPTSRDVFPSLVNVPSADFVAAALRRSEDGSLAVDEASLRAAARGDEGGAPTNASEASPTGDDGVSDEGFGWLTPWEARVSTVVWRGYAADAYAPRAPFGADPMGASRCATLLRRANANEASDEGTEFEASEPASEVGSNANASSSSGGGGSAASGSGGRGARASAATAAEWAARALADDGPAGRTTPGWRAVMLSVVARRGGEGGEGGDGEWIDARFLEEESEEESNKAEEESNEAEEESNKAEEESNKAEEEKKAETSSETASETSSEESASEESASSDLTSSSSRETSSSDTERDATSSASSLSCASALPAYFSSAPPLSASERQRHKYALDVGDATVGSRSALETLRALASGALLFRVSSPLSDAFALAELEPWTHYVPVKPDLSDLRDLVDWARRDEDAARTVAARGAAWARAFGAEKAWARYFSLPLGRVAGAYQYAYEPDVKKQLEESLVPLFAYDAAASGDESGHTGVFLEEAGGVLEEEEPRGGGAEDASGDAAAEEEEEASDAFRGI